MSSAPRVLVLGIRLHDGRYHGVPEWPPAPGRVFQALVAGSGPQTSDEEARALRWLEALEPPIVAAPAAIRGQQVTLFVPNNDLDAKGGDPAQIANIRVAKQVCPWIFDPESPFLYAWRFDPADTPLADDVVALSERLYQLGRGVDMAWARGEILDEAALEARLGGYPGRVCRPTPSAGEHVLPCPAPGSLDSLVARYEANAARFAAEGSGRKAIWVFAQPPKPRFAQISYDSLRTQRLFELRPGGSLDWFSTWPLTGASTLVERVRDAATARLSAALPDRSTDIERVLVGRSATGPSVPKEHRARIVPLPSIGHEHADRAIRRILVEVPPECPIAADDVFWAFSGLELARDGVSTVLVPSDDRDMLGHYGVDEPARTWRTVTAAALPEAARRRRIEPTRRTEEAKGGHERAEEQHRATFAVMQALRHAGVRANTAQIRVQREPFEGNGARAEPFAEASRFAKERLWHVEITLREPVRGPLVLGDGRFLGLGVMAPFERVRGAFAFVVVAGLASRADPSEVTRALRRAVMARVQEVLGRETLPTFFSGHERDGAPARTEDAPHLSFVFDAPRGRLLVLAPHLCAHRTPSRAEERHLGHLEQALSGLCELRAGRAGRLTLRPEDVDPGGDPLFAPARIWQSATPYQATRHAKGVGADEALRQDLRTECHRRGLPEPAVTPLDLRGVSGVGLVGGARLTFAVAVPGPIVLGRSRHHGGGLFVAATADPP